MSEKEIIEYLEHSLNDDWNYYNCTRVKDRIAIQGILNLYKQEKKKNKELLNEKESVFDKGYFEGTKDGEEEIRDEIRAIIKEYYEKKSIPDLVISKIEDLLEENKSNENNI